MQDITDDVMKSMLGKARLYTVALMQPGPRYEPQASRSTEIAALVWEHGRRNFELRAAGQIAMVGPADADGTFLGMAIFTTDLDETGRLLDTDPAVVAGIFSYQLTAWWSFPGDGLPARD